MFISFERVLRNIQETLLVLSFQLKCSSNIDSIHYLGLTNSIQYNKILFKHVYKLKH
jgi:hypothetical protein